MGSTAVQQFAKAPEMENPRPTGQLSDPTGDGRRSLQYGIPALLSDPGQMYRMAVVEGRDCRLKRAPLLLKPEKERREPP